MRKFFYIFICTTGLLLAFLAPSLCMARALALTQTPSADEPRFTPPPGEETAAIKNLIDKAEGSLAKEGTTATALLTSADYMPAHEWPRFRKLIRDHAKGQQLTIVTPQEPGASLVVTGTVRNQRGGANLRSCAC
jgi:hypothetical protein